MSAAPCDPRSVLVRLDAETLDALRSLARAERTTIGELAREAIRELLDRQLSDDEGGPLDAA